MLCDTPAGSLVTLACELRETRIALEEEVDETYGALPGPCYLRDAVACALAVLTDVLGEALCDLEPGWSEASWRYEAAERLEEAIQRFIPEIEESESLMSHYLNSGPARSFLMDMVSRLRHV